MSDPAAALARLEREVVAEVPQEPPQPLRASQRPVCDDLDARPDPGARRRRGESLGRRKRMPPLRRGGQVGEIVVDVEERGPGNVARDIELASSSGRAELPPAVDELIAHDPNISRDLQGCSAGSTTRT